jgi:Cell Wall Hydrolase
MSYVQWLAALCIWREARGTTLDAMTAIWWVIQNRANDPQGRWPKTIPGVILEPKQFSSFNSNDPNSGRFPNPPTLPTLISPDWTAFLNVQIAMQVETDPTNGANAYESLPSTAQLPPWADPQKLSVTISGIRFYRL